MFFSVITTWEISTKKLVTFMGLTMKNLNMFAHGKIH